jgi:hypothetical protein
LERGRSTRIFAAFMILQPALQSALSDNVLHLVAKLE